MGQNRFIAGAVLAAAVALAGCAPSISSTDFVTGAAGGENGGGGSAHHELLRGSDDTSDDSFACPGRREGALGGVVGAEMGAVMKSPSLLCRTCRGLWVAFTVGASFVIVMTVLGLHVQMKLQLDSFRTELEQGRIVNEGIFPNRDTTACYT